MKNCEMWLAGELADKELHLCDDIREMAQKNGFTKAELRDARKSLRIKTFHQFDEEGEPTNWFW